MSTGLYSQETIDEIESEYGSYKIWQTIVNMRNMSRNPAMRNMSSKAQEELKMMQSRIKELERLAEIGKATEHAIKNQNGHVMVIDYLCGIPGSKIMPSVDGLLMWWRSEQKEVK